MQKKILFLAVVFSLALPFMALAQTIQGMVEAVVYNVAWPIAIGAVVVLWIATGILFLSSLGDPGKLGAAKKALFASIAGTLIIVLAASAIALIRNALGI